MPKGYEGSDVYEDSPLMGAWKKTKPNAQAPAKRGLIDILHDLSDPATKDVALNELKTMGKKMVTPGTYTAGARSLPHNAVRGTTGLLKRIRDVGRTPNIPGKWAPLAIPAGIGAGAILDKYLKGDY
jgi:hypothetical protein